MKVDIRYNNHYERNKRPWKNVKIKIHNRDLWSASSTLAYVIHATLVEYRKLDLRPSLSIYPPEYKPEEDTGDAIHHAMQEKWGAILDEMIYAFYWINHDSFGPYGEEIHAACRGNETEQWHEIFKKYDHIIEAHENKIKDGLRLFGEHFQSLWS